MALTDDKPRILAALAGIPGVAAALPSWPKDKARLPCIVVSEAGNTPEDSRDDDEYIVALAYYARVFSNRAEEQAAIASAVDDVMRALGYRRTFSWEDDGAEVRQKVLRYQKRFSGGIEHG
jgi:hypothetical protein